MRIHCSIDLRVSRCRTHFAGFHFEGILMSREKSSLITSKEGVVLVKSLVVSFLLVLILALGANAAQPVFETDFSTDPGIVSTAGDWVIRDGVLVNQDIEHNATNAYIRIPQEGTKIIYEYKVTYKETISDSFGPLGGILFMLQDPDVRNDAYFLYGAKPFLKFVKTGTDDTFAQLKTAWTDANFASAVGQSVEYRIEYNVPSGEITVFANGQKVATWQDANPTAKGEYVSFRTNSTIIEFDYFRVYVEK